METYYRDKQSGEIITEDELLGMVGDGDQLDSFYLIGDFESYDEAKNFFEKNMQKSL